MKPLFWYAGGKEKAEFVARPLPDEQAMRGALAAEASARELYLRLAGLATVVLGLAALGCWARQLPPLPWPTAVGGAVIASLYGTLKLGQRRRRARLAGATDLVAEFRRYRRRLSDQLEIAILLGVGTLIDLIMAAVAPYVDLDLGPFRGLMMGALAAFLVGDLLVIERLRRLMRRSRA